MNSEDFEKLLEQQTIRPIPSEWRRDILQTANAQQCARSNAPCPALGIQNSKLKNFLNEMLWPCPQAWAGLATIWVLIFVLNFSFEDQKPKFAKAQPSSHEMIFAMKEQRRLYLELVGTSPSEEAAEPPKEMAPRPQSKRQTSFEIV